MVIIATNLLLSSYAKESLRVRKRAITVQKVVGFAIVVAVLEDLKLYDIAVEESVVLVV